MTTLRKVYVIGCTQDWHSGACHSPYPFVNGTDDFPQYWETYEEAKEFLRWNQHKGFCIMVLAWVPAEAVP